MPTGYTADIQNDISFEDYALGCARAFGACIEQRDDNAGDAPKLREADTYYEEKLPKALAFLGYLQSLDDVQQEEFGNEERDKEIARIRGKLDETQALNVKYEQMVDKVKGWEPPTPNHVKLKDFMFKQIVDSIVFDCDTSYYTKALHRQHSKSSLFRDFSPELGRAYLVSSPGYYAACVSVANGAAGSIVQDGVIVLRYTRKDVKDKRACPPATSQYHAGSGTSQYPSSTLAPSMPNQYSTAPSAILGTTTHHNPPSFPTSFPNFGATTMPPNFGATTTPPSAPLGTTTTPPSAPPETA